MVPAADPRRHSARRGSPAAPMSLGALRACDRLSARRNRRRAGSKSLGHRLPPLACARLCAARPAASRALTRRRSSGRRRASAPGLDPPLQRDVRFSGLGSYFRHGRGSGRFWAGQHAGGICRICKSLAKYKQAASPVQGTHGHHDRLTGSASLALGSLACPNLRPKKDKCYVVDIRR